MVARFGAAEKDMLRLPSADGWLHADAASSCNMSAIWVGVCGAKSANCWGQGVEWADEGTAVVLPSEATRLMETLTWGQGVEWADEGTAVVLPSEATVAMESLTCHLYMSWKYDLKPTMFSKK